jgi:hypothetical protein
MPWVKQSLLAKSKTFEQSANDNNNGGKLQLLSTKPANNTKNVMSSMEVDSNLTQGIASVASDPVSLLPLKYHVVNYARSTGSGNFNSRGRPHLPKFKKQKVQTEKGINK